MVLVAWQCLQTINIVERIREPLEIWYDQNNKYGKTWKALEDFYCYIENNRPFIPNYSERHPYGKLISTGFVESAVNQVIAKRFAKKQQMRWARRGAHDLLQVRVKVLNEDLYPQFQTWYRHFNIQSEVQEQVA